MAWILSTNQITRLQFEITNYCNAGCPQCARVNYLIKGWAEKVKSPYPRKINSNHFDIEKYKQILENDSWDSLNNIHFCGNYDEPTIHPEFMEIIEYTYEWLKKNSIKDLEVTVSTNGGTRNKEFWKKMGEFSKKYWDIGNALLVMWGIDGLEDTNHIYRQGVHWEKLIENVNEYHKWDGYSCWQWIRFQHNEHQFQWAQENWKKMGFHIFKVIGTNRPMSLQKEKIKDQKEKIPEFSKKKIDNYLKNDIINTKVDASKEKNEVFSKIKCKALDINSTLKKSVYIDAFGYVFPCCWMGTDYSKELASKSFLGDMDPASHNINNHDSMGECLKSPYFDRLIDSWKEKSYEICRTHCTSTADAYVDDRKYFFSWKNQE